MVLKNKEGKLCFKAAQKKDRISKDELEDMLMNEEIMGSQNVMTRRNARKLKYNEACIILQEKGALVEEKKQIENKSGFDCLDKNNTPYRELVRLSKDHHLNYKGTRAELCERLKNIGYEFKDNNDILENNTIKCYKLKKNECGENVDNCTWLPQIIDRDNTTNKQLLINRLHTLDKLSTMLGKIEPSRV